MFNLTENDKNIENILVNDLTGEIKNFDLNNQGYESEYSTSDESESEFKGYSKKITKVYHSSNKSSDPNVYVQGTNVSKTGKLKPSTEYCYLNNFHNFWKWLHEKYNYVIYVDPPEKICKSFTELKQKIIVPPIIFNRLKPEMFFEYIGTNDTRKYTNTATMVKQGLKNIFKVFGYEDLYYKLMMDIRNKEILYDRKKVFKRSRFIKNEPLSKRKCIKNPIIIDDDNDDNENINNLTSNGNIYNELLYLKNITYHLWERLEYLTPDMKNKVS